MKKLLIIGLDCATPQFVFDAWKYDLPNLNRLMDEGIYGELKSTIPPITVPAWSSMLSSKDPGQMGIYGFRNRKSYNYDQLYFANASFVTEKMAWHYLDKADLRSILLGVPQTYPPKPLNGIMVSSFLTPDKSVDYTYPRYIKNDLDRVADGDYIIDVDNFRTDNKEDLLNQIYLMTERRFKVVRHFLKNESWDLFMFVEMGIDRIHHGFWRYQDRDHRLYEPGGPYEDVIKQYYQYIDLEIGSLIEEINSDTAIMVVSDHGARRMEGAICINDWLIKKGYLHLKRFVDKPSKLDMDMIDWGKTRVWGEGGYYSRIFLNVRGREPEGIISHDEYDLFRNRLAQELKAIGDEQGRDIGTRVFRPEEIYRSVKNIPPDLIVYFGNLSYRAAGTVGNKAIHIFKNDTGPDDANHAENGIFIFHDDPATLTRTGFYSGQRLEGISIYDIAPTILDNFGLPIPPDMIGRSILKGKTADMIRVISEKHDPIPDNYYSGEEEEMIQERLEDLGYL